MEHQTKQLNAGVLSGEILDLARGTLLVHLRFMERAICQLVFEPMPKGTIATDGQRFRYSPTHVLLRYRAERESVARDYLHCVLHCVFRHMYVHGKIERRYWTLACDIAVEQIIAGLGVQSAVTGRQKEQQAYISSLRNEVKTLTAEKLYRYYLNHPLSEDELSRLSELFCADDHTSWYPPEDDDRNEEQQRSEDAPDIPEPNLPPMESEQTWRNIAESIEEDIKTLSREAGDLSGDLRKNLNAVNREKYDYAAFLKKFAVRGEVMRLDPDEFDYIFYTYGLKLYQRMPLIEPLEYREEQRVRTFVVAIDTSGSVSDELVHAFLQKTYNILQSEESFFRRIALHVIQCDTQVQEDACITSTKQFEDYLRHMTLHGFGGTDFRPVFEYVDQLRKEQIIRGLKGLIYFTDGCGVFPEKKPDYDTAFVFVDDDYNNYDVPVWAIKLILQQEEITEG